MNEMMFREILDQPECIKIALPNLRKQSQEIMVPSTIKKIILTGSGDSYFAALACETLYRLHLNCEVRALGSLAAGRYERYDSDSLLIAVSISGGVSRTIEAAARARSQGATTVAIVASEESPLGSVCERQIVMPSPLARNTPHTRDYSLTLATIAVVVELLTGSTFAELDAWPDILNELIRDSFEQIPRLMTISERNWFLGAGPDLATARYGAMKFWEGAAMQAWADDLEEFAHGIKELTQSEDALVVVASHEAIDRAVEMFPGLIRMGLRSWFISDQRLSSEIPSFEVPHLGGAEWMPFVSCIPMQVLTYLTAMERGIEATLPIEEDRRSHILDEIHTQWSKGSRIAA